MTWNKWPYWVRGGVVGLLFSIVLFLISVLFIFPCYAYGFIAGSKIPYCQIMISPYNFIYLINLPFVLFFVSNTGVEGEIILMTFGYVLEGLLLGWLYGKIKKQFFS